MKIRILGDSLRLRLSQTEVNDMLERGMVKHSIRFGPRSAQQLNYILQKATVPEVSASFNSNTISVLIPNDLADNWASSDEISIERKMSIQKEEYLKILIEKDFKCLKERPGESESDLFPNPDEESKC
ncbi:MAG: hypothetical protein AB8F74_04345 [Saprospiraceae bacterium]